MMNRTLTLASLMSANEDFMFDAVAQYLGHRTRERISVLDQIPWKERERMMDEGEVDVAWICGYPYVLRADNPGARIELLAAPVVQGERYKNKPVYFSDVIVHRDSQFLSFADLKGSSWVYNEPFSHSGYNVVQYHLASLGLSWKFFGKVVESGAHLTSLGMVLRREVDASAIDSIVLEIEARRNPELMAELRIVESLGPSPIPPFVVSKRLPPEMREMLGQLLTGMSEDPSGRVALAEAHMSRLACVRDADYGSIRYMHRVGMKAL